MKMAPLLRALEGEGTRATRLVHTGQHYDSSMSDVFFDQLGIRTPDVRLDVGSDSHARQTARILERYEEHLNANRPTGVVVVGDVNSTLACTLTAVKLGVPVAHVEAGLRSFDRSMPEEINRVLTDAVSDWLFVSEPSGLANLRREGVSDGRVHFVGNVMIDTLVALRGWFERSSVLADLGLPDQGYAVATLHRPSNVDDPAVLDGLVSVLDR